MVGRLETNTTAMVNSGTPKKFIDEFKAFAMKGNVVDLAVAVVIGGAFGKIVNSLVADVITPLIGLLTGGLDLTQDKWIIRAADEANKITELSIGYGSFLQAVIDFFIIALAIFVMLKILIKARLKEEEKPAPAPEKSDEVVLLEEIRDLLKK